MDAGPPRLSPWHIALTLGRVSNLPTVWTNLLAGTVLAGAAPDGPAFVTMLLAMSLMYVGGMYLNDAFDRRHDAVARPERPIPAGLVDAATVFAAGLGMLAAALALLASLGLAPLAWGTLLAATILLYDAWHKHNPASPVLMGLCRGLVYLTAAAAVTADPPAAVWIGAAVSAAYVSGLTWAARNEHLAGMRARVGQLIAGIALVDALLMVVVGAVLPAALAVAAYPLTRLAQRRIAGT